MASMRRVVTPHCEEPGQESTFPGIPASQRDSGVFVRVFAVKMFRPRGVHVVSPVRNFRFSILG